MIHSATKNKAEKMGVSLSEDGETGRVDAHWVQHNVHAFGYGNSAAKAAMAEMEAIMKIKAISDDFRVVNHPTVENFVLVFNHDRSLVLDRDGATPTDTVALLDAAIEAGTEWKTTKVPEDGAEAHAQGFHITDNPFNQEDDEDPENQANFDAWEEAWENAAEAAVGGEEEDEPSGSVVKPEYRIRYAEAGHPNHCGDWLANTLNSFVLGSTKTDIEKFEELCTANGVDLSKYNRTTSGWQGRLRMTGRNLLARKVYLANGVLLLPESVRPEPGITELRAPADWLAAQRFKMPKAELAQAEKQAKAE